MSIDLPMRRANRVYSGLQSKAIKFSELGVGDLFVFVGHTEPHMKVRWAGGTVVGSLSLATGLITGQLVIGKDWPVIRLPNGFTIHVDQGVQE